MPLFTACVLISYLITPTVFALLWLWMVCGDVDTLLSARPHAPVKGDAPIPGPQAYLTVSDVYALLCHIEIKN